MDSPSGRVPELAPARFLVATEACGGGIPDLGYFLEVSVFIGIFGIGFTAGGFPGCPRGRGRAHPPRRALHPRGSPDRLLSPI